MRHSRSITASTQLVLPMVLLFFGLACSREPIYEGRPVTEWLEQLVFEDSSEARDALRSMGSNAVPVLIRELRFKGSREGFRHLKALRGCEAIGYPTILPALSVLSEVLPREGDPLKGPRLFYELGRSNALPYFRTMITNENSHVRDFASRGLLITDISFLLSTADRLEGIDKPLFEILFERRNGSVRLNTNGVVRFLFDQ